MNIAAKVAQSKEKHPERFCPTPRCLWRTDGTHCPRHAAAVRTPLAALLKDWETGGYECSWEDFMAWALNQEVK